MSCNPPVRALVLSLSQCHVPISISAWSPPQAGTVKGLGLHPTGKLTSEPITVSGMQAEAFVAVSSKQHEQACDEQKVFSVCLEVPWRACG